MRTARSKAGGWMQPVSTRMAALYPAIGSKTWFGLQTNATLPRGPAPDAREVAALELLTRGAPGARILGAIGVALVGRQPAVAELEKLVRDQSTGIDPIWADYGRARLGDRAVLQKLRAAAERCVGEECKGALIRYGSAVELAGTELDEAFVVRVLADEQAERKTRGSAAWLLAWAQVRGKLSTRGLEALLDATRLRGSTHVAEAANTAVQMLTLNREELQKYAARYPSAVGSLLVPWGRVASAEDLQLLQRYYPDDPKAAFRAVARAGGPAAVKALIGWYGNGRRTIRSSLPI